MAQGAAGRHRLAQIRSACMTASMTASTASEPVVVGARGGTIHQHQASSGDLFQVCFEGICLFCESLHVGMAHLNRMERTASPAGQRAC